MQIFAHRGASSEFPENTLLAFEQAIIEGADGIELDVQYHHSGELIVLHDFYLDKTTNTTGSHQQLSLADLLLLDAGQGQHIPTLQQVLALIDGRCTVNIELKFPDTDKAAMTQMITLLQQQLSHALRLYHFDWSHFIVSSFNHHLILAATQQLPQVKTAALIASCPLTYTKFTQALGVCMVNVSIDCINETLVKDARQRGLKIGVYTVDQPADLDVCYKLGVDAIFTNTPGKSRQHLKTS